LAGFIATEVVLLRKLGGNEVSKNEIKIFVIIPLIDCDIFCSNLWNGESLFGKTEPELGKVAVLSLDNDLL
jgi:hypothetical protein